MKNKVLASMKPKVASLGFSAEELDNVAEHITTTLTEDATDEQITSAIESSLPYLKLSQTAVNRIVNAKKEKAKANPEQKKDEDHQSGESKVDDDAEVPTWAQALLDKVTKLEEKEVTTTRLDKFQALVKDLPESQQKSMIGDFKRIKFNDDEDFESYLTEKQELVPTLMQDNANAGLGKGKPGAGGSSTDAVDDFVSNMAKINEKEKE